MSFLAPLFLAGIAAAAIPLLLHLFNRRAEPVVEFAAMRYLRRAPVEQARRRTLKELLLLALRVTALVLLAVAFARPYFGSAAADAIAPATVVLIDTSLSISAPGQIERARDLARAAVRDAPATHSVAVMTFSAAADALASLAADRGAALAAIDRLQPGAGATRYRVGLSRAAELLAGRPGRIVVVTDLQQSGWDAGDIGAASGVPEQVAVDVLDVGSPARNVAVVSLRVEGTDAIALVRNFGVADTTEQVTFSVDDRPVDAVAVRVVAGGSAEARVAVASSAAVTARVTDSMGYTADNARYAVLDGSARPKVLAVTAAGQPSEAFYIERALSIAEAERGFEFTAVGGPAFAELTAGDLDDVDVIAILATRGLERRGRDLLAQYVRGGGGLLLTAGPDVDTAILASAVSGLVRSTWTPRAEGQLAFAPDDSRHPVFRPFGGVGTLGHVRFTRAAAIASPDSASVIARYSDGSAALVEERVGAGRVLVFGSDLNHRWNDFPVQPAFVPFVHEMLRYLAAERPRPAEYLVGDLAGYVVPGVVSVTARRRVAINVDTRESDPARMTPGEFAANVTRLRTTAARQATSAAEEREDGQRLWQVALLLMVAGLAAEGMLGRGLG